MRLYDIAESIQNVRAYTRGVTRERFLEDSLLQDAVVRRLEVIGEAVKGLSRAELDQAPEVPWGKIAGTRDKLIHGYYIVDFELVWETVTTHLEPLRLAVERILGGHEEV